LRQSQDEREGRQLGSALAPTEQGIGSSAEAGGRLALGASPRHFRLQGGDARIKLGDRKGIEILGSEQAERIAGRAGQEFVRVHDALLFLGKAPCTARAVGQGRRMAPRSPDIPETMTAIDPEAPGGPEVLVPVSRAVPEPGPGEVLVEVKAAGVNRPDVLQRMGLYPMPPDAPSIPGLEIAGEVVRIGPNVSWPRPGDAVVALVSGGGYAEWCVAPAAQCLPVPDGWSFAEAAGLPETHFTVWFNLFRQAGARAGDKVLVHGGTSGIGITAIDLGRAFGLEVMVTCGTAEKCAAALAAGAAHAIDYKATDFVEELERITGGRGVDILLDMVGGDYVPRNLACLAQGGRHQSIAFQRGMRAELDLALVMRKQLRLSGSFLRPQPAGVKAALATEIRQSVWPRIADGSIPPRLDSTFPLAQADEAHRRMEAGLHVGKIVLVND
jgi:NADPH2:quinone reductase